jgi:hypothetical protein
MRDLEAGSRTEGGAVYFVEFFEPQQGVDIERFRSVVSAYLNGWAADHPEDELVCTIGRTWWLGPEPAYLTIWKIADVTAFERWRSELADHDAGEKNEEFGEVCRIVQAGLYEDIGQEIC